MTRKRLDESATLQGKRLRPCFRVHVHPARPRSGTAWWDGAEDRIAVTLSRITEGLAPGVADSFRVCGRPGYDRTERFAQAVCVSGAAREPYDRFNQERSGRVRQRSPSVAAGGVEPLPGGGRPRGRPAAQVANLDLETSTARSTVSTTVDRSPWVFYGTELRGCEPNSRPVAEVSRAGRFYRVAHITVSQLIPSFFRFQNSTSINI
jgi:hypothetical protein